MKISYVYLLNMHQLLRFISASFHLPSRLICTEQTYFRCCAALIGRISMETVPMSFLAQMNTNAMPERKRYEAEVAEEKKKR